MLKYVCPFCNSSDHIIKAPYKDTIMCNECQAEPYKDSKDWVIDDGIDEIYEKEEELNDNAIIHKLGNIYTHNMNHYEYMLVRVSHDEICLVNITNGSRYNNYVKLSKIPNEERIISDEDFDRCTDYNTKEFYLKKETLIKL